MEAPSRCSPSASASIVYLFSADATAARCTRRRSARKGSVMRRQSRATAFVALLLLLISTGTTTQTPQAKKTIAEIRKELLQLPYYGVFDFIAFSYSTGTVTLQGYAYEGRLKTDAERAVKRASGVDQVVDKIEDLPST